VLDLGAGSGILSIAALKLGARSVRAIDLDAETVDIARENARLNEVADGIVCAAGSLEGGWPWPEVSARASADLVICNISSTVVLLLMRACAGALRPGGIAILSGFIARDADEVRDAAVAAGLWPMSLDAEGEWRCLVALKQREGALTMDVQQSSRLKRPLNEMSVDVARVLKRRRLDAAYRERPAYQQNDYLGWIARAKRPETRERRLAQMLDELAAGDAYMGMRWRPRS